jgi:hypothetical protein
MVQIQSFEMWHNFVLFYLSDLFSSFRWNFGTFARVYFLEGSHSEASDLTECTRRQKIFCTGRRLCCNTAVMSSVDGHYEQPFSEVANSTREDGYTAVSAGTWCADYEKYKWTYSPCARLKKFRLLQCWAVATVVRNEEGLAEWHCGIKCQNINYMCVKTTHVTVTYWGWSNMKKFFGDCKYSVWYYGIHELFLLLCYCVYLCIYELLNILLSVWHTCVCVCVCMYIRMCVCVCMYVRIYMYVCMYVFIFIINF